MKWWNSSQKIAETCGYNYKQLRLPKKRHWNSSKIWQQLREIDFESEVQRNVNLIDLVKRFLIYFSMQFVISKLRFIVKIGVDTALKELPKVSRNMDYESAVDMVMLFSHLLHAVQSWSRSCSHIFQTVKYGLCHNAYVFQNLVDEKWNIIIW